MRAAGKPQARTMTTNRHGELTWTQRYALGARLNLKLEPVCTFVEIAEELGVTKQNAYTETVLALGKLAWGLIQKLEPGGTI